MPVNVIDTIVPKDGGAFPVVADTNISGGIQVQPNFAAIQAIPLANQKVGMLAYDVQTAVYYQLTVVGSPGTWVTANLGGATSLVGDVTGSTGASSVVGIRGTPVSTNSVAHDGYALVSTGGTYVPTGVEPIFNIKNFGANTAASDNTAAIQAALDTAGAAGPGSVVLVPIGTFAHAGTLILPLQTTLRGMGIDVSILQKTTLGDGVQSNCLINGDTRAYQRIERLTIANTIFASLPNWQPSHTYSTVGTIVIPSRYSTVALQLVTAGTSDGYEPVGQLCNDSDNTKIILTHSSSLLADHTIDIIIASSTTFQYSVDGGSYSSAITIASTPISGTQYTATFPSVSYTTGVTYTTPYPRWSLYTGTTINDGSCIWQVIDAGAAFRQTAGTSVIVDDIHVIGYNIGIIFNQTELGIIQGITWFDTRIGVWLTNNIYNTSATTIIGGLTNRITIAGTIEFNGGIGVIDDGGLDHEFRGCNWNNFYFQAFLCGVVGADFVGGEYEGSSGLLAGYTNRAFIKGSLTTFFDRFIAVQQGPHTFHGGASFSGNAYPFDYTTSLGSATCIGLHIHDIHIASNTISFAVIGGNFLNGFHWGPNVITTGGLIPLDAPVGTFGGTEIIESNDNSLLTHGGVLFGSLAGSQIPGCLLHVAGGRANVNQAWNTAITMPDGYNNNLTNPYLWSNMEIIAGEEITTNIILTGIVAQTDGFEMEIVNTVGVPMTIANKNSSSLAANRIWCPGNADVVLTPAAGGFNWAKLRYSSEHTMWLLLDYK